ncbi:hypothetical protein MPTK2_1g23070 [Marchantia polymorpha subsp. ruderalis]
MVRKFSSRSTKSLYASRYSTRPPTPSTQIRTPLGSSMSSTPPGFGPGPLIFLLAAIAGLKGLLSFALESSSSGRLSDGDGDGGRGLDLTAASIASGENFLRSPWGARTEERVLLLLSSPARDSTVVGSPGSSSTAEPEPSRPRSGAAAGLCPELKPRPEPKTDESSFTCCAVGCRKPKPKPNPEAWGWGWACGAEGFLSSPSWTITG